MKRRRKINWGKITGVSVAVSSLLGGVAMLPYELGSSSLIISPHYKEKIALAGLGAAFALRFLREIFGWPEDEPKRKPRSRARAKPRTTKAKKSRKR